MININFNIVIINYDSENFFYLKIIVLLIDIEFLFNCIFIFFIVCDYIL